jgi:uncharacterized repeat protein (TIGR03803 family)
LAVTAVIGTLLAQLPGTATEVVLHNFNIGRTGANPFGGVVRDSAGNLYGTTRDGGAAGHGVVFKVDPTGHETVLYSFSGGADGGGPVAGVIGEGDGAGIAYGTAAAGGSTTGVCAPHGCGVVFKLDAAGQETVLYTFTGGADGANPQAGVVRDSAGNLYGTAYNGGIYAGVCASAFALGGCGVVYKVDPTGHETVLYSFTGGSDGRNPLAGVIGDSAGNLYGTTQFGGITTRVCGSGGCGVVYKVDMTGHETVLYSFTGSDGANPQARLIRDSGGNLYGTTANGGACCGVVFKIDTAGHETVLHAFADGSDGGFPYASVIGDSAGNLYGTTLLGGTGNGVVFKLDATGHETTLYSFTGGSDGGQPFTGGVIGDAAGNLYGTASGNFGSTASLGVVYKLDPTGHETVLYSFSAGADGSDPSGDLIADAAGNLYGTTPGGGSGNAGVVFKLDPAGNETVLHSFTGTLDGAGPGSGVIRDPAGNLYGPASGGNVICARFNSGCGVVFKLDPAGQETVLYNFTGGSDGFDVEGGLIRDSADNLYGTAYFGGTGNGVVFKLDATGHETTLYSFTGGADGANPQAGLIRDSAGNLYGTTANGGACCGVVFKIDTAGRETVLHSSPGPMGVHPWQA